MITILSALASLLSFRVRRRTSLELELGLATSGERPAAATPWSASARLHRPAPLVRTWGKVGETPIVATGTGARFGFSLISAITSKGHMRFMITEGGVNAGVFIEFLKRLLSGATQKIFLIVDRGPAHRAKKTKAFVESLGGALRLFFLPPYSPDLNPDELVWNHLKTHTVGRTTTDSKQSFRGKVLSSMRSLQNTPKKIAAFFQKPSLKYAA
jgi:transposase